MCSSLGSRRAALLCALIALSPSLAEAADRGGSAKPSGRASAQGAQDEEFFEEVSEALKPSYVQTEIGLSYLGEISTYKAVIGTLGLGARFGRRWGRWGAFVGAEYNAWFLTDIGRAPIDSVLNLGLGGEYRYFRGRVRASLAIGSSTALFSTELDRFATTGFFTEIRPAGLRFSPFEDVRIELAPLSLIVMVPLSERIPLVVIAYRTVMSAEVAF